MRAMIFRALGRNSPQLRLPIELGGVKPANLATFLKRCKGQANGQSRAWCHIEARNRGILCRRPNHPQLTIAEHALTWTRPGELGKLCGLLARISPNCVIVSLSDQISTMPGARRRFRTDLIKQPLHVMPGEAKSRHCQTAGKYPIKIFMLELQCAWPLRASIRLVSTSCCVL